MKNFVAGVIVGVSIVAGVALANDWVKELSWNRYYARSISQRDALIMVITHAYISGNADVNANQVYMASKIVGLANEIAKQAE